MEGDCKGDREDGDIRGDGRGEGGEEVVKDGDGDGRGKGGGGGVKDDGGDRGGGDEGVGRRRTETGAKGEWGVSDVNGGAWRDEGDQRGRWTGCYEG